MAHFLFVDESGQDHHASPYEVLAGLTVEDRDSRNLVAQVEQLRYRTEREFPPGVTTPVWGFTAIPGRVTPVTGDGM
jgi:hypothetical protein